MSPALWILLLGSSVAACGVAGMWTHKAKGYGYLLYCLGLFAVGTATMFNAPSLASIILAGFCYLFAFVTIFAAALAQREREEGYGQQPIHQGQDHGGAPEEAGGHP